MDQTLYRRPLPADAIAFSSPECQQVFKEALALGGLDGYFQLAEQFHTQSDPSFCGLGSLVVALNALAIDLATGTPAIGSPPGARAVDPARGELWLPLGAAPTVAPIASAGLLAATGRCALPQAPN